MWGFIYLFSLFILVWIISCIFLTVKQCENQHWPVSPFWASNWLPSQLQWTGRRCITARSCGWKNDAWNTCFSHDTNQMNGVFTYSDNNVALERNSAVVQERSFSRRLTASSSRICWTDPSHDVKIILTGRDITQSVSLSSQRFIEWEW